MTSNKLVALASAEALASMFAVLSRDCATGSLKASRSGDAQADRIARNKAKRERKAAKHRKEQSK